MRNYLKVKRFRKKVIQQCLGKNKKKIKFGFLVSFVFEDQLNLDWQILQRNKIFNIFLLIFNYLLKKKWNSREIKKWENEKKPKQNKILTEFLEIF
jgi:hypothetical protein